MEGENSMVHRWRNIHIVFVLRVGSNLPRHIAERFWSSYTVGLPLVFSQDTPAIKVLAFPSLIHKDDSRRAENRRGF
jgi:hypothetical protein